MKNPNISDPYHPEYDSEARDIIMNLASFYDPHHKCNIVREDVFKRCLEELRQRERKARGISKDDENKDPAICPKCGTERVYYDGWNCPTEGCDIPIGPHGRGCKCRPRQIKHFK